MIPISVVSVISRIFESDVPCLFHVTVVVEAAVVTPS